MFKQYLSISAWIIKVYSYVSAKLRNVTWRYRWPAAKFQNLINIPKAITCTRVNAKAPSNPLLIYSFCIQNSFGCTEDSGDRILENGEQTQEPPRLLIRTPMHIFFLCFYFYQMLRFVIIYSAISFSSVRFPIHLFIYLFVSFLTSR